MFPFAWCFLLLKFKLRRKLCLMQIFCFFVFSGFTLIKFYKVNKARIDSWTHLVPCNFHRTTLCDLLTTNNKTPRDDVIFDDACLQQSRWLQAIIQYIDGFWCVGSRHLFMLMRFDTKACLRGPWKLEFSMWFSHLQFDLTNKVNYNPLKRCLQTIS